MLIAGEPHFLLLLFFSPATQTEAAIKDAASASRNKQSLPDAPASPSVPVDALGVAAMPSLTSTPSEEQEMKRSEFSERTPTRWRGMPGGTEMSLGPLSWRRLLFHISAATSGGGAAPCGAGWQPLGKRTHLLYEIISFQIQHRMSPVWGRSGEAGLWGGGGQGGRMSVVSRIARQENADSQRFTRSSLRCLVEA